MSAVSGLEQNISKTVKVFNATVPDRKTNNLPVRVQSKKRTEIKQYLKQI